MSRILQATEELARREGFLRLETARIAEAAGISIGSLYQYFANLDGVLLMLYEQRSAAVAHRMKAAMVKALDASPRQALPDVMWLILREHEKHHLILHRMIDEVPQLNLAHHPASLRNLVHGSVGAYLKHRNLALTPSVLNRKAFFLENIVLGCIRSYLDDSRKISRKAFIADLTQVCIDYIDA